MIHVRNIAVRYKRIYIQLNSKEIALHRQSPIVRKHLNSYSFFSKITRIRYVASRTEMEHEF